MSKPAILILGATSDIGRAVARAFAAHGHPLHLAARDAKRLATEVEDVRIRGGGPVTAVQFDVLDTASLDLAALDPPPGIVVCVIGLLGHHERSITDPAAAELVMRTNYLGPALALEAAARFLEARGGGILMAIGSIAGDRGRAKNYVYGSAKAGLAAYLSGMRARLHGSGVRVVTVKPGYVDTRMTAGMTLPKALTAQPEEVAAAILRACHTGPEIVYVRPIWRWIMTIIRLLPEFLFKRLKF